MSKIFLDEPGTEMHVELYERRIADGLEAVDLAGLDDEDIAGTAFEGLAVDGPESATFADELNFVIRMTMGARSGTRFPVKKKNRDVGFALISPDKIVRTPDEGQVLLAHVMHPRSPAALDEWECCKAPETSIGRRAENGTVPGYLYRVPE